MGSLIDKGELIGAQILGKSLTSIAIAAFRPFFINNDYWSFLFSVF
ncbi:MAG: hypothetical protein CM1200mP12_12480 [Gammaproteobacteria bacterium]|nr:MAG: hypothetical protein CM1200mP12_12480 [Gammaproteobacteria bacterium]